MKEKYRIKTTPKAKKENIILGKYYRITFLTEQLVRFEYNEEGEFEDHATQIILNRDFEKVDYRLKKRKELRFLRQNFIFSIMKNYSVHRGLISG